MSQKNCRLVLISKWYACLGLEATAVCSSPEWHLEVVAFGSLLQVCGCGKMFNVNILSTLVQFGVWQKLQVSVKWSSVSVKWLMNYLISRKWKVLQGAACFSSKCIEFILETCYQYSLLLCLLNQGDNVKLATQIYCILHECLSTAVMLDNSTGVDYFQNNLVGIKPATAGF